MHVKLHKNIYSHPTHNLLINLNNNPELKSFYLVGGTALALYLGHRESIDLDFFSGYEFTSNLVNFIIGKNYEVISIHNNSIELIIDGIKVFFFYFAFPRHKEIRFVDGVRLADPIDIGLMKLLALQGRATRKDIIDLYFIDKEVIPLEKLLALFEEVYPKERFNSYDSLKNLLNKSFLDSQPMPKMLKDLYWDECMELVSRKIVKFVDNKLS